MSIINVKVNEYGEPITINNPNQTITNIQNFSFDDTNFRLQGLEVRNFEDQSVTINPAPSQNKSYPSSITQTPTTSPLVFFAGVPRQIGPFNMATTDTVLVECSFGFVNTVVYGAPVNPVNYPKYTFELGYADNSTGVGVTAIPGTQRTYQSNLNGIRRIGASCTIVHGYKYVSSAPVYFYLLVSDGNYPSSQNPDPVTLTIYSMTFFARTYQK